MANTNTRLTVQKYTNVRLTVRAEH